MKIRFWGVRGSIAAPGVHTVKFGGNTSCYELISKNGTRLILDAGTGLRELGQGLIAGRPTTVHLLISHTHWDHIQGFPFFGPAFIPGNVIHLYGPVQASRNLASVIRMQMDYEVFPVREAELNATLIYHDLGECSFEIDDLRIRAKYTNHPVMTLSYRIEDGDKVVVYSGDTEPYYNVLHSPGRRGARFDPDDLKEIEDEVRIQNRRHIEFCRDADLLIHDAQYTEAEYMANRRGWGHSPIEHAWHVGRMAEVRRLALSHHDPTRHDNEITELEARFSQMAKDAGLDMDVFFARESMEIQL